MKNWSLWTTDVIKPSLSGYWSVTSTFFLQFFSFFLFFVFSFFLLSFLCIFSFSSILLSFPNRSLLYALYFNQQMDAAHIPFACANILFCYFSPSFTLVCKFWHHFDAKRRKLDQILCVVLTKHLSFGSQLAFGCRFPWLCNFLIHKMGKRTKSQNFNSK